MKPFTICTLKRLSKALKGKPFDTAIKPREMNNLNLVDKNGTPITAGDENTDDDVLFDGENYWRIYVAKDGRLEMVGYGYIHNVTQETVNDFLRIGKYADNEHLLIVD